MSKKHVERALLAGHLASKVLITNGLVIFKGDHEAYTKPLND